MSGACVLVLDVGKTNSKLTLWSQEGRLLASRVRANMPVLGPSYVALDVDGVEAWLERALRELVQMGDIGAIIPVAHGAAAALIKDDYLALPPTCYEDCLPPPLNAEYDEMRDPFAMTGSPRLPLGLNLGAQLYRLEKLSPKIWPKSGTLVTFPQYWAWRLCGVTATEVTSLGCHTDLWRPFERRFSDLALRRGWAERMAPLRDAREILGSITPDWVRRTGLPGDCVVLCGLHDSNAAFYGARAHPQLAGRDVTVLSTGTWFVAMRAPAPSHAINVGTLSEARDTLINVDVDGNPAPSARFMGGREVEHLIGGEGSSLRDADFLRTIVPDHVDEALATGAMILPSFVPNVGPFGHARGRWEGVPLERAARRAAVGLYLGLVGDASLSLVGACEAIVIEGRFADDTTFVRTLATLRPECDIYLEPSHDGLAFGALRLWNPTLAPKSDLVRVQPLRQDISAFAARWRYQAAKNAVAA